MTLTFERPVGAPADVAELEYVSGLHQTDVQNIREDCSVTDKDISLFLMSRYGIRMTQDQVAEQILRSFGRGGGEKAESCLDLVQIVSLLLIPKLRREQATQQEESESTASSESKNAENSPPSLISYVLNTLLHDTTGEENPVELTPTFIKELFMLYGESELADDDQLIQDMIDQVTESDPQTTISVEDEAVEAPPRRTPKLDAAVFTKLLTDDLQLYDLKNESRLSTNFDDVFKVTHKDMGRKANQPLRIQYFASDGDDMDGEEEDVAVGGRRRKKRQKMMAPITPPKYFTTGDRDETPSTEGTDHDEEVMIPISPVVNCLDLQADTFRSGFLVVALWTSFAISYFTYYFGWNWQDSALPKCDSFEFQVRLWDQKGVFFCRLGWSILRWIYIMITMGIYGLVYFGLAGIGNNIENRNPLLPLIGFFVAVLLTALPAFLFENLSDAVPTQFLKYVSVFLGCLVIIMNTIHFVDLAAPRFLRKKQWWKDFFTPQGVRAENSVKHAASHKVGRLIDNAREIQNKRRNDAIIDTYCGQALFNFSEAGDMTEKIDGFHYTWRNIFTHKLFKEEGVWYSGRLLSINVTQFIVAIFVLLVGLVITVLIVNEYDANSGQADEVINDIFDLAVNPDILARYTEDLLDKVTGFFLANELGLIAASCPMFDSVNVAQNCDEALEVGIALNNREAFVAGCVVGDDPLCTLFQYNTQHTRSQTDPDHIVQGLLLEEVGVDVTELLDEAEQALNDAVTQPVDDLYPQEKYMIFLPLLFGTLAAFVAAWSHAVTILPSATTSVLKLRAGLIPFLRDPKVRTMRIAPDQVAYLQGSAFWGILLSSLLFAAVVGGLIFIFLWQVTYHVAFHILATFCGVLLVILIHWLIVRSCRSSTSTAYYRQKPARANIVLLLRECAFFALTVGFVVIRAGKLIFTAFLYLGRIDTPFLADGVGELECSGYRLDGIPYVFLMDMLQHEAHRHPYIETLGVMYMMKLKHGESFGTAVGSAWRLLFVFTLMPWLWKYRKAARPDLLLPEEFESGGVDGEQPGGGAAPSLTRQSTLGALMFGRQSMVGGGGPTDADALRWKLRVQKQESAEREALLRLEVRHLQEQLDGLQAANLPMEDESDSLAPPPRALAAERNPSEFRRVSRHPAPHSEDTPTPRTSVNLGHGRHGEPKMLSEGRRKTSVGLPIRPSHSTKSGGGDVE